jgi:hypothetical protein
MHTQPILAKGANMVVTLASKKWEFLPPAPPPKKIRRDFQWLLESRTKEQVEMPPVSKGNHRKE